MQNNDNKVIRYGEVCNNDERDMVATQQKIMAMFKDIKIIFRYLQNKSKRYPLVDTYAIEYHFIKPAEFMLHSGNKRYDVEIVIIETLFDEKDPPANIRKAMNRSQFTEFLIRLAKMMYMSNMDDDTISYHRHDKEPIKDREYDKHNINDMRVHVAVGFLEGAFKRWAENIKNTKKSPEINRKYDLWVYDVELTFTMNEENIRNVF